MEDFLILTQMPYQSPLHILKSLEINPNELTEESINRLRKKLLSEFNLNPTITIDINGKAYTKDAILKTIDKLKEVGNLKDHQYFFERKNLLTWLENPLKSKFPQSEIKDVFDFYPDDEFRHKVLANAFDEYIKYYFKNRHFRKIEEVLTFVPSLHSDHSYDIFENIYSEIAEIVDSINEAQHQPKIKSDKARFGFITEPEWTDFLNNLPEDFEALRDTYCYAVVNYTVVIQAKDRKWTYEISSQLAQTGCEKELKDVIDSNHAIYRDNFYNTGSSSEESIWSSPRMIFFAIIIIIRIVASCGSN
jgi:hypothetical protein